MVKLYYRVQIHEQDGTPVYDSGKIPSHSYVIQFLELMYGWLTASGDLSATDTSGAEQVIYDFNGNADGSGRVDAPAGEDNYGVLVGLNTTGPTAESNTNFQLDTQVADGNGGGQLEHQAVVFAKARDVAGTIELDVSRPFINNSGGQIDIEEIGLVTKQFTNYHLIMRDVIGTLGVGDTQVLTVTYVLQTTA